jgi:hypothetical protein
VHTVVQLSGAWFDEAQTGAAVKANEVRLARRKRNWIANVEYDETAPDTAVPGQAARSTSV